MKKQLLIGASVLALLLTAACNKKSEVVTVKGETGPAGQDGYSVVAKTVSNPSICGVAGGSTVYLASDLNRNLQFDDGDQVQTQYITCNGSKGQDGLNGSNGSDGQDGVNGLPGRDGLNGTSCTVNKVGNVATITCGSSSAVVVDGQNGSNGQKGDKGDTGATGPAGTNATGIYITEVINPCGSEFSNDEVFLRLSTGRILALYDGGPQEDRLALLVPGNYVTTDRNQNHACAFTITNTYQITNERVQ